ncbi:MmpS family protein [Mycolicibacterium smegmatis]|nr:MmpS family transport accessory protein [Mycolicibacterium smegmatis]MDF1897506.1 MmpS family transport accessory protein [Mycolicibacterium smegmatis]MDF1904051.1 MmpS family transport accessory protein [Mycolicibacterium smegmatis]MDF1917072.1 MmpS family transport accessory protein [Mycolicibacterium smegmatis]MDF1922446.1 MmpS family transport accessory protein [Mycolicibacterium smegmatis]UAK56339.1 MmpS family protein [Mycolicibacterium smegmatis]
MGMTDSPRRDGNEPTQQFGSGYPVEYPDPAYANQTPYGGGYPAAPNPVSNPPANPQPTQQMPAYPPYGYDPYASGQYGSGQYGGFPPAGPPPEPEPEDREPRMWLWVLAALAVLVVVGLVIALVIANGSRQETVVAPPVSPQPSFSEPTTTAPSPSRTPRPVPVPPRTSAPTSPTTPGATETVVYEVAGEGRAINITYLDTGGMLQTEFNVLLPWSKQVELPEPAKETASVSVLNFGPEVSCTVTVDGLQTQHRTGSGLTICVGTMR